LTCVGGCSFSESSLKVFTDATEELLLGSMEVTDPSTDETRKDTTLLLACQEKKAVKTG